MIGPYSLPSKVERIRLELRKVGVGVTIAQHLRLDVREDYLTDQLVYGLSSYVLTHHLANDTYSKDYYVPASWFQHFKRDHLPTFAKRWPVKTVRETVTVAIERYHSYPEASINMPNLGNPKVLEIMSYR